MYAKRFLYGHLRTAFRWLVEQIIQTPPVPVVYNWNVSGVLLAVLFLDDLRELCRSTRVFRFDFRAFLIGRFDWTDRRKKKADLLYNKSQAEQHDMFTNCFPPISRQCLPKIPGWRTIENCLDTVYQTLWPPLRLFLIVFCRVRIPTCPNNRKRNTRTPEWIRSYEQNVN